ncbi:MAG: hypothetical protein IJ172_06980 [Ruminococcus sp.]|nr:hypothetical protein [Ruminococcus sp.]
MNPVLEEFLEQEVTDATYEDLFNFVSSRHVCRGTFECLNHVLMKVSSSQLIIFKNFVGAENTKAQDAVLVAKEYLLMKINSKAYKMNFDKIKSVLDN